MRPQKTRRVGLNGFRSRFVPKSPFLKGTNRAITREEDHAADYQQ